MVLGLRVKIFIFLVICLLLFFIRFADFSALYSICKYDTLKFYTTLKPNKFEAEIPYFKYLGFSNYQSALREIEASKRIGNEGIIIIGYFNLVNPFSFLIYTQKKESEVVIPQPFIHLAVEEGLTVAQFYKFNFLKVKNDRGVKHFWAPYIGSKMCDLMLGLKRKSKILNIAYFFIPLLIFLVLSFGVSRKYFILFFYYFISSILLISQSFLESPFYVFHLLNINLSEGASRILGFLIFVCYLTFAYFIYLGYKNIKKEGMKFEEKLILAFFFLLPIFLRF